MATGQRERDGAGRAAGEGSEGGCPRRDITAAAGGKAKITVDYGIRPGGRARVNVVSDSPEEEYGNETTPKTRAIGRAAREGR